MVHFDSFAHLHDFDFQLLCEASILTWSPLRFFSTFERRTCDWELTVSLRINFKLSLSVFSFTWKYQAGRMMGVRRETTLNKSEELHVSGDDGRR